MNTRFQGKETASEGLIALAGWPAERVARSLQQKLQERPTDCNAYKNAVMLTALFRSYLETEHETTDREQLIASTIESLDKIHLTVCPTGNCKKTGKTSL